MSPRALAAVAVFTAGLAGPAAAQGPLAPSGPPAPAGFARVGEPAPPAPLAPVAPPGMIPGNPYAAGAPGAYPPGAASPYPVGGPRMLPPSGDPVVGAPAVAGPMGGPPPAYDGPPLPTDGLVGPGGPRGPQCWVGAEYILYWTRHAPLPIPIATIGPAAGLGIIGTPGVQTIVGSDEYNFHTFSGVRVTSGYWFNQAETVGIESDLFVLPTKRTGTPPITGTDILPTLARPFFDTALNRQNSRLLTRPGTFAGGISTDASQMLWGAEVLPVWRFYDRGGVLTLDAITGFKFLSLEESLQIDDFSAALSGGIATFNGQSYTNAITFVHDHFATANRFYGGVVGLRSNFQYEAFTLGVTGKLGLGTVHEEVRVDGSTSLAGPFPTLQTTGGGFYATGANSGTFSQNQFAVVPELNVNLAVQVTRHLTFNMGYTFLYIDRVVRPGDQLSANVNSTLIPTGQNFGARFGPQTPGMPFNTSSYWANGFNFGFAVGF